VNRKIDAAIFDLGGVLMRNGTPNDFARHFPDVAPHIGVAAMMGPYGLDTDHPWHRLERGEITMDEFRAANRTALVEAGITMPANRPPPIVFERNEAMWALVADLRAAGVKTSVLTNNVRELRSRWWSDDFEHQFDDIVDSHEVGIRKPNQAIYELAVKRLGVAAYRAAFLDDIASNVAAAAATGIYGLQVLGAGGDAIDAVRRLADIA
jgi:putative hydrolase of the HAD superfamily